MMILPTYQPVTWFGTYLGARLETRRSTWRNTAQVKPVARALAWAMGGLLAVTLSGCAAGPDTDADSNAKMVSVSQRYLYADEPALAECSNQGEAGTLSASSHRTRWWQQFNDATLNALVVDLQQQALPLKMAAERVNMAKSYHTVVESFKVPTVSVGAGYYNYQLSKHDSLLGPALNPLGESVAGLPPQLSNATVLDNQHDGGFVGLSVMWELDVFGRLAHQSNAAKIRVEQAQIYQSGLTTLLTADVVHNYIQYRGAEARIALLRANIADQTKTLELVQKVVESGYGSDVDLAQAQTLLAATQSLLPQLQIAQQVHKQRLALLLGESLTQVDARLASSAERPNVPRLTGGIPVGLPSDLLKRRPDIRMAEREIAAMDEALAVAVANRYPKFYLTGAPGLSASRFDDLFSGDSLGWAGSVGISWTVFDGGRGKALVEIQDARLNNAMLGYQHAVDAAILEVDSLLFAYGRSQENQQRIDQALLASERALGKAKALYQAGLVDHLTVLDAQRQHRAMEDRVLAARLQTAQVTVGVFKSLGGDWHI